MRRVFGLGETVLDIIFKNGKPLTAKAGGSVLNALVSLSRLGHNCHFISELGSDKVGDTIIGFLHQNNIGCSFVQRYNHGQSALAMAFLNDKNDAEYDFYKNYPPSGERLKMGLPDFKKGDILLFGSSYAILPEIRNQLVHIVEHAYQSECIIIYDPNFRKKHNRNQEQYLQYLQENFGTADIVRGSNEDFDNIYNSASSEQTFFNIQNRCSNLVYTANANGLYVQTPHMQKHYPVPQIKPISTIGAGDNFNAGMIHGILKRNINKNQIEKLDEENWDFLIDCGIKLSTEVCLSEDNYVGTNFSI